MKQAIVETRSVIRLQYRTLWILCLALLGILLVLHLLSFFIVISRVLILIFLLPLFAFQVIIIMDYNMKSGRLQGKRRSEPLMKVHINPWLAVTGFLIFAYFMFSLISHMSFGGVPTIEDGQYVINNHGEYTAVIGEVYRKALMSEARSSSALFMGFLYVHFGYFFCKKTRAVGAEK